jgi:hypothetical protein
MRAMRGWPGGSLSDRPLERRKALLALSQPSQEINAMSSHHDYIIEITAQHDALKPFAPENGQPLRFKIGDAVIYTNGRLAVPAPRHRVLPACRAFGAVRARCALSAELVIAVDAGFGIQPAP